MINKVDWGCIQVVNCGQAGGENTSRDLSIPAGLPKLFKSALDWNLYTNMQKAVEARQVLQPKNPLWLELSRQALVVTFPS